MFEKNGLHGQFPVRLTLAQRIVVAEILPDLSQRLRLDEPNQKTVSLSLDERMRRRLPDWRKLA